jgi:hypothetical protein
MFKMLSRGAQDRRTLSSSSVRSRGNCYFHQSFYDAHRVFGQPLVGCVDTRAIPQIESGSVHRTGKKGAYGPSMHEGRASVGAMVGDCINRLSIANERDFDAVDSDSSNPPVHQFRQKRRRKEFCVACPVVRARHALK